MYFEDMGVIVGQIFLYFSGIYAIIPTLRDFVSPLNRIFFGMFLK